MTFCCGSFIRLLVVVLVLWNVWTESAQAESIGLRFVVGADLARTPVKRQMTLDGLHRYVEELNGYYAASRVHLQAEIVEVTFAAIKAQDALEMLSDMQLEKNGFDALFARANEIGADYSVAVVSRLMQRGRAGCGRAFAVNQTLSAISSTRHSLMVMAFACGAQTLAHELGHLMGLNHGRLVAECYGSKTHFSAIAPYAQGWGNGNCDALAQTGEFGSIMIGGYMRQIDGNNLGLPMFSNPLMTDVRCGPSQHCGDPDFGDAARALNENAHRYAAHEEPDVHTLPFASDALKACMMEKYRGVEIIDLKELVCPRRGIRTLKGIERLTALQRIDVSDNPLENADELKSWLGKREK